MPYHGSVSHTFVDPLVPGSLLFRGQSLTTEHQLINIGSARTVKVQQCAVGPENGLCYSNEFLFYV